MSDVFISYARSTEGQAKQIAEALRALGYDVWRDDEIPANRAYAEVIEERLAKAMAVVVIWSADAARSEWVRSEAERARADRKLVQLSVDGARLPMPFDQTQCANLADWSGDDGAPGWKQVIGAIASLASPTRPPDGAPGKAARKLSICVLPFANMSGDPEQEYFSDGISEDIITDLSKISALGVIARNTAFQFKGKSVDASQLARQLNVSHLLEGSVRKAGARVRITAQLIDGASGEHAWAERYDRELTDIFALQDEISEAIVKALKLKLLPEEKAAIERRGTNNPEAYNLFLMARRHWVSGNTDVGGLEMIARLCRSAVEIDPDYARAWALIALVQTTLTFRFGKDDQDGLATAERALALDPDLGEAHVVRATYLAERGRDAEADAEIDTAIRLDPGSYEVFEYAGKINFRRRRLADAISCYERAAAIMETAFAAPAMLISCYAATRDGANVRRVAELTLRRAEAALAEDQTNGQALGFGATALAALGEGERTREWIARALRIDPNNRAMRYNLVCALGASLGDIDGAIALLSPYLASASRGELHHVGIDPDLDPLRDDPRFQAMVAAAAARLAAADIAGT